MSWLARSIANSLRLDDDDAQVSEAQNPQSSPSSPSPTVKEDFSEITKTLTRQFWGVASFLAPPPEPSDPDQSDGDDYEEALISGIRSDFAEMSGRVKFGISKIASNFLQLGSEEVSMEKYESTGVTEEVLTFVNNVAMHPKTWLDFPVPDEDDNDEFDDFGMSDAQQEHALAVEHLVPRLAALRMELCPGYMNDGCFWKIYFVLLHPRLDKHVAILLSTPQIMEARALLTRGLRNRTKSSYPNEIANSVEEPPSVTSVQSESQPLKIPAMEASPSTEVFDSEMDRHAVQSTEIEIIDKSIIQDKPVNQTKYHHHSSSEDDNDDWLKEDTSEIVGVNKPTIPIAYEEDVSFSDLEDDDDDDADAPASYKKDGSDSSGKDSQDWVQLGRSST